MVDVDSGMAGTFVEADDGPAFHRRHRFGAHLAQPSRTSPQSASSSASASRAAATWGSHCSQAADAISHILASAWPRRRTTIGGEPVGKPGPLPRCVVGTPLQLWHHQQRGEHQPQVDTDRRLAGEAKFQFPLDPAQDRPRKAGTLSHPGGLGLAPDTNEGGASPPRRAAIVRVVKES